MKMQLYVLIIGIFFVIACSGMAMAANISEQKEIFIQEGSGGTFIKDESGNYTLTIRDVIPYTIYFTDRPIKSSGFAPMDKFISGFNWDPANPPNAAIMLRESAEEEDIIIGQLTSPKYDEKTQVLVYSFNLTSDYLLNSDWLQEMVESFDDSIPEEFGQVILAIDGCPCVKNYTDCGPSYCNSMKFKWYKCNCDWDGLCCDKCWL